jgi:hypothetical protein
LSALLTRRLPTASSSHHAVSTALRQVALSVNRHFVLCLRKTRGRRLPARSTLRSSSSARARSFWSSRPRRRPRGERATRAAQLSATSSSRGRQPLAAGFRRFLGGRVSALPILQASTSRPPNYRAINYPVCTVAGRARTIRLIGMLQRSCARGKDCSAPIGLPSPHPQSGRRTRPCGRQVRLIVALVSAISLLCYLAAVLSFIECELRDERPGSAVTR